MKYFVFVDFVSNAWVNTSHQSVHLVLRNQKNWLVYIQQVAVQELNFRSNDSIDNELFNSYQTKRFVRIRFLKSMASFSSINKKLHILSWNLVYLIFIESMLVTSLLKNGFWIREIFANTKNASIICLIVVIDTRFTHSYLSLNKRQDCVRYWTVCSVFRFFTMKQDLKISATLFRNLILFKLERFFRKVAIQNINI